MALPSLSWQGHSLANSSLPSLSISLLAEKNWSKLTKIAIADGLPSSSGYIWRLPLIAVKHPGMLQLLDARLLWPPESAFTFDRIPSG